LSLLLPLLVGLLACDEAPSPPRGAARPLTPPGPTGDPRIAMTQAMDLALTHPEVNDLWPDRPYRVDLRDESGAGRATLGLLDLDRDGAWDMRWTRAGEVLMVANAPADDGQHGPPEPWSGPQMPGRLEVPGR